MIQKFIAWARGWFMAWARGWMMASFTKIRNVCKGTAIGGGKISSVLDSLD